MKKSIALISVLIFIFTIILLISQIFNIYEKIKINNFAQTSIYIKNISESLKNATKDINSSDELENLFVEFPISIENFRSFIKISPLSDKLNLNLYLKNKKIDPFIDKFLDNLLYEYDIADPLFFKDLILDTLDKDDIEREALSEHFPNGNIVNFNEFNKILNYYYKQRNDKNIFKIPWRELIYFSNEKTIIDCNLMPKKLVEFLNLDYQNELNCDNLYKNEQNLKILNDLDIIPYEKGKKFIIKIAINGKLKIYYELSANKVLRVENNPVY